jgi:hypothetical protein
MSNAESSNPRPASDVEETRLRVETFKSLVDDVVAGRLPSREFIQKLRDLGASPEEGKDYIAFLEQRLQQQQREPEPRDTENTGETGTVQRETTPEGLTEAEISDYRARRSAAEAAAHAQDEETRKKAAESAAWAILHAKISQLKPASRNPSSSGLSAEDLAQLLDIGQPSDSSSLTLPSKVLELAPYLGDLSGAGSSDPHVDKTWKLRRALASEKTLDTLVDLMQVQSIPDPIPRSIWKTIAQDQYVDFEKLFASMDRGYDHRDEPREFAGGFALIKKDNASARKPLRSESDWCRVFNAWRAGVCLVYRHRTEELGSYYQYILNMFRASPDPKVAINFDLELRDRYSKCPFRMDNRSEYEVHLLSQLFRASSSSTLLGKRTSSSLSSGQVSKRASTPCQIWNHGKCADPCVNKRLHGTCSECGAKHRARDEPACYILLQAKRTKLRTSGGYAEDGPIPTGRA